MGLIIVFQRTAIIPITITTTLILIESLILIITIIIITIIIPITITTILILIESLILIITIIIITIIIMTVFISTELHSLQQTLRHAGFESGIHTALFLGYEGSARTRQTGMELLPYFRDTLEVVRIAKISRIYTLAITKELMPCSLHSLLEKQLSAIRLLGRSQGLISYEPTGVWEAHRQKPPGVEQCGASVWR
jgi:hypothetical protein